MDGVTGPHHRPVLHHRDRRTRPSGRDRQGHRPDGAPPGRGGNVPADRVGHPRQPRGVDFRSLRIETKGDYDLPGYMALDPKLPPASSTSPTPSRSTRDAEPATSKRSGSRPRTGPPSPRTSSKGTRHHRRGQGGVSRIGPRAAGPGSAGCAPDVPVHPMGSGQLRTVRAADFVVRRRPWGLSGSLVTTLSWSCASSARWASTHVALRRWWRRARRRPASHRDRECSAVPASRRARRA